MTLIRALTVCVFVVCSLQAQSTRGVLVGNVVDPSGSRVAGA